MKGFIIQATYRIIDERPYIFIFGCLENQESFVIKKYFRPYFYILKKDVKKAQKHEEFEVQDSEFTDPDNKKVAKILVDSPKEVSTIRRTLEENKIKTFEADVPFATRFLIDHKLQGGIEIEGDYETGDFVNRIYNEPEIEPTEEVVPIKTLSYDIETNSSANKIYCISLVMDDKKLTLIHSNKKFKNCKSFKSESEMIESFIETVRDWDPDIITGWNIIDFDFKVLRERCQRFKIPFAFGRDNSKTILTVFSDFLRDSKINISGRVVLDGFQLLRNSFIQLDDYKLDTAAKKFTKKRKLIQFENKGQELDKLFKKNQQRLIDYNLLDAELVLEILENSGTLDLAIQKSLLTGMPLDKVSASIASLDSIYLKETRKRKIVVSTRKSQIKERKITGGFVKESQPGLHDNIVVLDFKSLYPSVILTFNIDPLTLTKKCSNAIKAPNGACFKREAGILPLIIENLLEEREKARKEKNELARYAIKILMNSFYGVLASPNCRFFNQELANGITHFAQHFIKLTAEKIEEKGYDVIYGDTDSVFIKTKAKTEKQAEKIGKQIEKEMNEFYKKYIKNNYGRESKLELEYEKCYTKFLMTKVRGTEKGAKKRYAGLIKENGKERIEITGLEFVRGDWTQLAKDFQYELLDRIFHNKEVKDYITKFVKDLKKGKYDDKLVYKKSLRKNIEDYAVNPPHVKAAKKLKKLESSKIEYLITEDGPEPLQNIKHEIDYQHYIDKQLKPIADTLLVFFDMTFNEILKGKQTNLFNY